MMFKGIHCSFLFICFFCGSVFGQRLKSGERAPVFEAVSSTGDTIRLSQFAGQKVFIAFFRYVNCPVCNYRVHELMSHYDSIRSKGFNIIAVFESEHAMLTKYLTDNPVPFAVIGDPELELYRQYRVEKSAWRMFFSLFKKQPREAMTNGKKLFKARYKRDGSRSRLPADFIVDENGDLKVVYYGTHLGDHLPLAVILNY